MSDLLPPTARLMPIPGKKAGDLTDFKFRALENLEKYNIGTNLFVTLARYAGEKNDESFRQLSRSVSGSILKNQSTLLSENLAKDERFAGLALLHNADFGAVGVPMAFAAQTGSVPHAAWLIFIGVEKPCARAGRQTSRPT